MLLRRIFCSLLLLSSSIYTALGQQYPFIHYTPKDGLVNSRVRGMYQDSKGRLFFLTTNGLSLYDGARFTNYTIEEGLPNPMINDVIEVGPDSLLIATNTGILNAWVRGSIVKVKTVNDAPIINKFLRVANGTLYLATDSGLYYFNERKFAPFPMVDTEYTKTPLTLDDVQQLGNRLLLKGTLDIACPGGLFIYDVQQKKLDTFITHSFRSLVQLRRENALLGFYGNNIMAFDLASAENGKLVSIPIPKIYKRLEGSYTSKSRLDEWGNLWYIDGKAVTRVDSTGNYFVFDKRTGLDVVNMMDVFIDKEKILWIITDGGGAIKLVNNNLEILTGLYGISSSGINAIYTNSRSDTTWLYNFAEKSIYGACANRLVRYSFDTPTVAMSIVPKPNGFYLLDPNGIFSATKIPGTTKRMHVQKTFTNTLDLNFEKAIADTDGTIFVPGEYIFAWKENKINFTFQLPYFTDQLVIDKHHQLWAAVRNGDLLCFTIHPDDEKHFLALKHNYRSVIPWISPRSLAIDSLDNVWIGTRYDGLWRFKFNDTLLASQSHFTTKDGLTDNFIVVLNSSRKNTIWAGSQNGVDKISFNNGKFTIEGVTRSNNVFEFVRTISISKDHKVWIRGTSGSIMQINDEEFSGGNNFRPTLEINSLKTLDFTFPQPHDYTEFAYNHNNLFFEAAAPTFIDEKQVLFSFLLNGSNNNKWSPPSSQANFNFINLPPGKYELLVKAFFPVADYEPQTVSYHFTITPPWWQTMWFKIMAALAIIGGALVIVRAYVNRRLEKQRIALEKMQAIERERTRIASDMHDDLGAGLSTIRFLGEKMNKRIVDDSEKNDIQKIVSNSNELVQKMNEIIWAMNEKNDSLQDLLFYTRSYAMEYCEEHNLLCEVSLPEFLPETFLSGEIRRNVFLMVKESLHNVVKHAEASKVIVLFEIYDKLKVSISDNGKGIQKINNWKSGNGLLNMKRRIHTLGGQMRMGNDPGFTLTFEIPLT